MHRYKISFLLNEEEVDFLREVLFLEPGLEDNLAGIKKESGSLRIEFDAEDLREYLGAVEYMIRVIKSRLKKQSFIALFYKLQGYLGLVKDKLPAN